jgi:hypothetical protein
MNIWGKLGKEYYSWYIENMDELEEFIIKHNLNVDYTILDRNIGFNKSWCSLNLKHQVNRQHCNAVGCMYIRLISYDDSTRYLVCKAIKAVIV